jgi:anti-sigma regulatory factor (Ser/Thr protein kinase)
MALRPAVAGSSTAHGTHTLAPSASFRHEALFYAGGDQGFLDGTLELVRGSLAREARVLVAVAPARAEALRQALGDESVRVRFVDMHELGRNPARIIPVWQAFISEQTGEHGDPLGIGEPVWPGRNAAELDECERHEALLNLAFDDGPGWRLLCPYDLDGLDEAVIETARHTHPLLACDDGIGARNDEYTGAHEASHPFAGALPAPEGAVAELAFAGEDLARVRRATSDWAAGQALGVEPTEDLVLAISELATNSILYGGGGGTVRYWLEADTLLCEVQDAGWIEDPLAGRVRPSPESGSGRGLWLVNQLCDLVRIRSDPTGSVVRVHQRLG